MTDRYDTQGQFSWCELHTRDVAASKHFYQELLGWSMEDVPAGNNTYTILQANGKPVGGIMQMPPQIPEAVPSHWGTYVTVDDVDATVQKALDLGARIIIPPTNTHDAKFCVFQDPQGAVLSIIQYFKKPE